MKRKETDYRFETKPKSSLFDHLQTYDFIIVTGPHRAGTTITAAMIANDLGYELHEDIKLDILSAIMKVYSPSVFHCPTHCHKIHEYSDIPTLAAVMVMRDIDDIIKSQKRIPWGFENEQLNFYKFRTNPKPTFPVQSPIAVVKYRYWQEVQRPLFGDNGFEVQYSSLEAHPLWVPPEQRKNFTANQLELGKPHGQKIQGKRV